MNNPYATLGVSPTANAEQIRGAYHALVKRYHPDVIVDPAQRETAQEKLVEINLAYEKALRAANGSGGRESVPDSKKVASSLYERGQYEAALRILTREAVRDAEWFGLRGKILMALKQPAGAHESFRAAVRLNPDSHEYRQGALDAAVAARREKAAKGFRLGDWIRKTFLKSRE
ncbi:MAG: DnaJ domain-containing protein [Oscillospiraceae bacterium]|jgi:tetratricopeptide (TPR) repeat protein|nr:DnaJ domain-containing protein [Oscillospiraceae bacterium]